jgi:nitrite reductase/ring-hydroxylating ferredoxin subunit
MAGEQVVCRVGELAPGETKKFLIEVEGRDEECFLVNYQGALHAWVNRCLHVPMTMDWVENRFFTQDKRYLQCATHGAWYEPDSGECIAGPPCGKYLIRVPIEIRGDTVIALPPAADGAP